MAYRRSSKPAPIPPSRAPRTDALFQDLHELLTDNVVSRHLTRDEAEGLEYRDQALCALYAQRGEEIPADIEATIRARMNALRERVAGLVAGAHLVGASS